jgi:hypothetical protein
MYLVCTSFVPFCLCLGTIFWVPNLPWSIHHLDVHLFNPLYELFLCEISKKNGIFSPCFKFTAIYHVSFDVRMRRRKYVSGWWASIRQGAILYSHCWSMFLPLGRLKIWPPRPMRGPRTHNNLTSMCPNFSDLKYRWFRREKTWKSSIFRRCSATFSYFRQHSLGGAIVQCHAFSASKIWLIFTNLSTDRN